jgi:2Fe-2S ferredoxin
MPRITFVEPSGMRREIDAPIGITLMQAAVQGGVQGILALCGGACVCGTCHVYIEAAWLPRLPALEEMEEGTLESSWQLRENSRLSCQIHVTADLEGLIATVPQRQGA